MPVSRRGGNGDVVTYRQSAHHRRIACSVDDPRGSSGLQRNLRRGQSDHRPGFGPFAGFGPRGRGGAQVRTRSGCWSDSTNSSSSSSTRRRSSSRGTTHEKYGAGEDADGVRRSHRLTLFVRVNENKTLFENIPSFFVGGLKAVGRGLPFRARVEFLWNGSHEMGDGTASRTSRQLIFLAEPGRFPRACLEDGGIVRPIKRNGNCGSYLQRPGRDNGIDRSFDDPRDVSASQGNLCSG